jgi:ketol-acid reductoisomerase
MTMLYDADIAATLGRARVAVLGHGAQGRAQALNLRDAGLDVVVGLRAGSASAAKAQAEGLAIAAPEAAVAGAELVAFLVPDAAQPALYRSLEPRIGKGAALVFAHGYALHYGQIVPRADLDALLVAPLGVGDQVRAQYQAGAGVPALVAVAADASGRARERAPGSSSRACARRSRPTCSPSRRCSVAGSRTSSAPRSTRWSRPATRPRSRTSAACTRSSCSPT